VHERFVEPEPAEQREMALALLDPDLRPDIDRVEQRVPDVDGAPLDVLGLHRRPLERGVVGRRPVAAEDDDRDAAEHLPDVLEGRGQGDGAIEAPLVRILGAVVALQLSPQQML
jgi:hypothetical protein